MSNYIFLEPYEDELIYSQLARIKVKSGYMAYIYAAGDFYMKLLLRVPIVIGPRLSHAPPIRRKYFAAQQKRSLP